MKFDIFAWINSKKNKTKEAANYNNNISSRVWAANTAKNERVRKAKLAKLARKIQEDHN